MSTTNPTCTIGPYATTGERCGKPAVHSFAIDGNWFHECADHTICTSCCPCGDKTPEVGPYPIRHGSGAYGTHTITVTETGEKIRTRSESPFLLICGGKIVARAYTTKTRDKWNRDWNAPVGLVVDMRGSK